MVVVSIDIIDILLSHSRDVKNHAYSIDDTPYSSTYRVIHPAIDYLTEPDTETAIEKLYNKTYASDGVSIKHNDNSLKVEFRFIDEKHHIMFMLKYT